MRPITLLIALSVIYSRASATILTPVYGPRPTPTPTPLSLRVRAAPERPKFTLTPHHVSLHLPTPTCVQTITPDKNGFVPPGTCGALYNFYPSFGAAIAASVIFGMLTVLHIGQAVIYQKVRHRPCGLRLRLSPSCSRPGAMLSSWAPSGKRVPSSPGQ